MTMDHQRGGDLYFKSGKDACMPSNLKALHILMIVTGRSSMKSSKIVDKERIIELMITKNRFRSWNEKRMRWTLLVGESQRNEEINPVIKRSLQVNPAIRKRRLSALPCQDFACHVFFPGGRQMGSHVALVKGNRHMGFQVDRATHTDFGSG